MSSAQRGTPSITGVGGTPLSTIEELSLRAANQSSGTMIVIGSRVRVTAISVAVTRSEGTPRSRKVARSARRSRHRVASRSPTRRQRTLLQQGKRADAGGHVDLRALVDQHEI